MIGKRTKIFDPKIDITRNTRTFPATYKIQLTII